MQRKMLVLGAMILAIQGCGGGGEGGGGDGGGNPPPPAATAPTVSLDTNKSAARVGGKVTLTWNSQNATQCSASGGWSGSRGISGVESIDLSAEGTASFTLTCSGAGGSATANKSVNTAPAMTQLTIPGAPAPVAVAKGSCMSTEDDDFSVKCITSAAQVPARYETFNSSLSGRVRGSSTMPPSVTVGGSCVAGFDRVQSRLAIDTTIIDHAFTLAGSSVAEISYKPSLLNSISQGAITQMSVLVFQDTSNTDRVGYVLYAVVSGEPLTIAGGGTIANNGTFDIVGCISDDGGATTPPPPPPTTLNCPSTQGKGTSGLGLYGATSYNISGSAPNQTTSRSLGWGVRYNNPNVAGTSYTGSLRVRLWAVSNAYAGGSISGYELFKGSPNFVGDGAKSANQIFNFYTFPGITSSGTGRNPPGGKYCMVVTLEEYTSTCSSNDGYCITDWTQFPGGETF